MHLLLQESRRHDASPVRHDRRIDGYQPSTPRAALAFVAVALAAITLSAMVVLPAKLDSLSADPYAVMAEKATATAPEAFAAGADLAPPQVAAEAATGAVAAGATQVVTPDGDASETNIRAGRTILGTQGLGGRRKVGLRSRTNT